MLKYSKYNIGDCVTVETEKDIFVTYIEASDDRSVIDMNYIKNKKLMIEDIRENAVIGTQYKVKNCNHWINECLLKSYKS